MCYSFSDKLWESESIAALINNGRIHRPASMKLPADNSFATKVPNKRRASTSLEHGPSKVAKRSSDENPASSSGQSETRTETAPSDKPVTDRWKQLKEANDRLECLKAELASAKEVEDERDQWRLKAFAADDDINELKAKLQGAASKNKTANLATSKRLESEIKTKWEKKLDDLQDEHENKLEGWKTRYLQELKKRGSAHDANVAELKIKHKEQQEAKDEAHAEKIRSLKIADQQRQAELKAFKDEHRKIQANLKAEQQAKIKEAKPETNKLVKEKDNALKDSVQNVKQLRLTIEKMRTTERKLESEVDRLEAEKKVFCKTIADKDLLVDQYDTTLKIRDDDLERLKQDKAQEKAEFEAKLQYEGRRWQLQYNNCAEMTRRLTQQQRSNLVLRNANDRNAKRIAELEIELLGAREESEALRSATPIAGNALTEEAGMIEYDSAKVDDADEALRVSAQDVGDVPLKVKEAEESKDMNAELGIAESSPEAKDTEGVANGPHGLSTQANEIEMV